MTGSHYISDILIVRLCHYLYVISMYNNCTYTDYKEIRVPQNKQTYLLKINQGSINYI